MAQHHLDKPCWIVRTPSGQVPSSGGALQYRAGTALNSPLCRASGNIHRPQLGIEALAVARPFCRALFPPLQLEFLARKAQEKAFVVIRAEPKPTWVRIERVAYQGVEAAGRDPPCPFADWSSTQSRPAPHTPREAGWASV